MLLLIHGENLSLGGVEIEGRSFIEEGVRVVVHIVVLELLEGEGQLLLCLDLLA